MLILSGFYAYHLSPVSTTCFPACIFARNASPYYFNFPSFLEALLKHLSSNQPLGVKREKVAQSSNTLS